MWHPSSSRNTRRRPLFEPRDDATKLHAALRFILGIATYLSDDPHDYLRTQEDVVRAGRISANSAIRVAIASFDYYLSDEIRRSQGEPPPYSDAASVYFRSEVYKQTYPTGVVRAIAEEIGYAPEDIVIAHPQRLATVAVNTGTTGLLTPNLAYWVNAQGSRLEKPEPPWGIPRQELFRSLLTCGVCPLDACRSTRQDAGHRG